MRIRVGDVIRVPNFPPGWITKRSRDGGFDFVGRLEFERRFGPKGLVVLGEAKLWSPTGRGVPATVLARLAAQLQRGWMGVFVTTGMYEPAAQTEMFEDSYPVVLLNGADLAEQLRSFAAETGTHNLRAAADAIIAANQTFDVSDVRRDPNEVLW